MLSVADRARADVTLTPDKVYYRFATEDTLEDGELPGKYPDVFGSFALKLLGSFRAGVGVSASTDPVRFTLFVNNTKAIPEVLNDTTLREFINLLANAFDEFDFLRGFA